MLSDFSTLEDWPEMPVGENNSDILPPLADRIRRVRGNLSRAEFAGKLGIHLNTLGHYERAQRAPDAFVLMNICQMFAVNPQWLLLGEGPALDEDRITVEPARAGSLCAGQPLARIVVKDRDYARTDRASDATISFNADTIQNAIIAIEQALLESQKSLPPHKKAELVVAVCELLVDMDSSSVPENVLKLIRLSA